MLIVQTRKVKDFANLKNRAAFEKINYRKNQETTNLMRDQRFQA